LNRAANASVLVVAAVAAIIAVDVQLGLSWPRFFIVAPIFLAAVVVAVAPTGRFLKVSAVFSWIWTLMLAGVLSVALLSPDFLTAGVLFAVSFVGWLAAVIGIAAALFIRAFVRVRHHGTT
jgi:hypothetical protein